MEGTICGCDWSGHVVQKGKNVTTLEIGDHVAGFVMGGTVIDRGAFAQYVKATAELAFKVPAGTLSHEEAATVTCTYASLYAARIYANVCSLDSFYTAVQALFHPTRLGLVEIPARSEKEEWVLIYGGSST